MSSRIYSEIRISHKTEEEKEQFKIKVTQQADKLGLTVADYIRLIIELDSASGLIDKLKDNRRLEILENAIQEIENHIKSKTNPIHYIIKTLEKVIK